MFRDDLHIEVGDEAAAAVNTTPEASDIQRMLKRALAAGCRSGGDGSVIARNRASIALTHLKVRVAVFNESYSRSPGLSRDDGTLFPGEGEVVQPVSLGSPPGASVINRR